MQLGYMKKVIVIIILLSVLIAAALFFHEPYPQEREFRGTFVRSFHGDIHQTEEEGGACGAE